MIVNISFRKGLFILCIVAYTLLTTKVQASDITDHLEQVQETSDITQLIILNNNIGNKLRYAYPDSALFFYTKSKELAIQAKDMDLLSGAYCSIGSVWAIKGNYESAKTNINKCLEIARKNNLNANIASGLNTLGLVQIGDSKNRIATATLSEALLFAQTLDNLKLNSKIYNNLGLAYKRLNILDSSLYFYHESLKIKEQINDQKGIGSTTNNIALIYEKLGNDELTYKYLTRSLLIRQENSNRYGEAMVLNNFGLYYERQLDYKQALNYYERSLDVMIELNKKGRMATLYNNIGSVYALLKNYKQAHFHLEKALKLNQESKNLRGQLFSLNELAQFFQDLRIYINAAKYYHDGLVLAKRIDNIEMISLNYQGLYACFEKEHKYDSALFYHKEYIYIKDSIFSAESKRRIERLEIEYDLLKTEKKNQSLLKENQLKEVKIKQYYLTGFLLAASLLFFIVVTVIILRNRNRQKAANILLIKQKSEIERQSTQLKDAFSKLKELSDFKEEMSGMIVHDLKNPINTIINIAELITDNHENVKLVKYSGKHMLNLVMNITDVSKYEQTGLQLNKKPAELRYIIRKAFDEVRYNFELKNIHLYLPEDYEYVVNVDFGIFERIFINLFTNAIKFSPVGSSLQVKYEVIENDRLKIHIIDNGPGIDPNMIGSIFEKYKQAEKRNLGLTGSTGLGLSFCKMAIEAHNGKIGVNSALEKGSDFWVIIDFMEEVPINTNKAININNISNEFKLLPSEKETLKIYIDQLNQYEIFQVSEIKKVIKPMENFPIPNIKNYYTSLCDAVVSCDEIRYNKIIDLVYS